MKNFVLIAVGLYFAAIGLTSGCGIATHTEIAHRASYNFDYLLSNSTSVQKLIQQYQSAFQAGNPYPDSFYDSICKKGTLHDVSEDTHWVPFINATIRYIQKTYPKPYSEDGLRLLAFTLGYVSHQMADVTWHSLGVQQGFISAMSNTDFHGSYGPAHSTADTGGDVVNEFELSLKYISDLGDWYVPVNDLYNIYNELYGEVRINKTDILECSSIMFLGRLGEQLAISLLYAEYYNKSTFLTDRLNDYFLGGMDDMATWTQLSWNKVLFMLENGVDACKLDHSIMFVDCPTKPGLLKTLKSGQQLGSKKIRTKEPKKNALTNLLDTLSIDLTFVEQIQTPNGGLVLKPSRKFDAYVEKFANYATDLNLIANKNNKSSNVSENLATPSQKASNYYYVLNDNANLGWSLQSSDLDHDGSDDLIMGAPVYSRLNTLQNGAVFIQMSQNTTGKLPFKTINLEEKADFILSPPQDTVSSRFGHSLTTLDLNLDGFLDLVVSAPSFGLQNITYQGLVFVYFGNGSGVFAEQPSIRITCQKIKFCNLGWLLTNGDVNGDGNDDLVISSPYANTCQEQCGLVAVLLSKKANFTSTIDVGRLDWQIEGHMPYEWFGFSVRAKLGILAVGAPQSRICAVSTCDISANDRQAVGRVYLYQYPATASFLDLPGWEEFEQHGYSVDLTKRKDYGIVLAVSSVGRTSKIEDRTLAYDLHRAGQVNLYSIQTGGKPSATLLSTLKSDRAYAAFGSKIRFYSNSTKVYEDLHIAAAKRSDSVLQIEDVQEGIVYTFKMSDQFPMGNITDNCSIEDLTPCPRRQAIRVFDLGEKQSKFGFDFIFLKSNISTTVTMAGSSINYKNQNSRSSGKVNLFDF